jgi:hypothetical protein
LSKRSRLEPPRGQCCVQCRHLFFFNYYKF